MLQKGDGIFRSETTLPDWLVAPKNKNTSLPIPPNAARPPVFHAMRVGIFAVETTMFHAMRVGIFTVITGMIQPMVAKSAISPHPLCAAEQLWNRVAARSTERACGTNEETDISAQPIA